MEIILVIKNNGSTFSHAAVMIIKYLDRIKRFGELTNNHSSIYHRVNVTPSSDV